MAAKLTPEELQAKMDAWDRERKEELASERESLRSALSGLSVVTIEAEYNGYGDSGDVEEISVTPDCALNDLHERLSAFIWSIAYDLHPGFENNEGGQGRFTWHLAVDRIDIRHEDNFTDVEVTEHEGV